VSLFSLLCLLIPQPLLLLLPFIYPQLNNDRVYRDVPNIMADTYGSSDNVLLIMTIIMYVLWVLLLQTLLLQFYAMSLRARRLLPYGIYLSGAKAGAVGWAVLLIVSLLVFAFLQVYIIATSIELQEDIGEIACVSSSSSIFDRCYYAVFDSSVEPHSASTYLSAMLTQVLQYSAVLSFCWGYASNVFTGVTMKTLVNDRVRDGSVASDLIQVKRKVSSSHVAVEISLQLQQNFNCVKCNVCKCFVTIMCGWCGVCFEQCQEEGTLNAQALVAEVLMMDDILFEKVVRELDRKKKTTTLQS
jgi:hypothetical protein